MAAYVVLATTPKILGIFHFVEGEAAASATEELE